jgi:hypothetical protein
MLPDTNNAIDNSTTHERIQYWKQLPHTFEYHAKSQAPVTATCKKKRKDPQAIKLHLTMRSNHKPCYWLRHNNICSSSSCHHHAFQPCRPLLLFLLAPIPTAVVIAAAAATTAAFAADASCCFGCIISCLLLPLCLTAVPAEQHRPASGHTHN